MAKAKELTQKEKEAQLEEWKTRVKLLDQLIRATPDIEGYSEEDWLWVKGNTKPHAGEFKILGLRFCMKQNSPHYQHWYLPAPRWFTEERRAREAEEARKAEEARLAELAAREALGDKAVLEKAAQLVGKLTGGIEAMDLECDPKVYQGLLKIEEMLIEAL